MVSLVTQHAVVMVAGSALLVAVAHAASLILGIREFVTLVVAEEPHSLLARRARSGYGAHTPAIGGFPAEFGVDDLS